MFKCTCARPKTGAGGGVGGVGSLIEDNLTNVTYFNYLVEMHVFNTVYLFGLLAMTLYALC